MNLLNECIVLESEKAAAKEVRHVINVVNSTYNEWKKIKRRVNAVDIISTTANKLGNISPETVDKVHEATRLKMATLIMRCLDLPPWKPLGERQRVYKKLYPLLDKLRNYKVQTGTGGTLREVVMTRMSASYCYQNPVEGEVIFVAYEPKILKSYIRYLFGDKEPSKVYKMQMLNLPGDFESLIDTLRINHEKCFKRYLESKSKSKSK